MPLVFTPKGKAPAADALVVCAGTITCKQVDTMGAGFNLFKTHFSNNISIENHVGGWKAHLQQFLDAYHNRKQPIPAYVRIARHENLIGGIATVPVMGKKNPDHTDAHNVAHQEQHYKEAVKGAVQDAKTLKRPLFIQPLGIGVYGWPPERAAKLFFDAIQEADPAHEVAVSITLYDPVAGSADQRFKKQFEQLMHESPLQELAAPGSPDPNESAPQKLAAIVGTLISNIENKAQGRRSSGVDSNKVQQLHLIRERLQKDTPALEDAQLAKYIAEIRSVCRIKRNVLHFWQTPHSVAEFDALLQQAQIENSPKSPSNTL